MKGHFTTTLGRLLGTDYTLGACIAGLAIGTIISLMIPPAPGTTRTQRNQALSMFGPDVQSLESCEGPVLDYKGKTLRLTGDMGQMFLDNWQMVGAWQGEPITEYVNRPGLGYDGEYLRLKKGVLVFPIEYEPKAMSLAEFEKRHKEPLPYP